MVAKKPDCIGQKFGRLTVIDKSGRCPRSHKELWQLLCDCGNTVVRTRNSFDRKEIKTPSCGCFRKEINLAMTASRRKSDCTGQKFGRLTVLGMGDRIPDRDSYRQLWKLQCDCGKLIQIPRNSFEDKGQISCGCARKLGLIDNNRHPFDITGWKFGTLTAIALTGKKDNYKKPTWKMQCDCGSRCEKSLSQIRTHEYYGIRINCGDRTQHPERYLEYPPTPNPYPQEAGELLIKYLPLTELNYPQIDTAVEDEKRDRLLRAAWILTYRRSQGEEISDLYEARIIRKNLRYCSIDVFWKRKLETNGGFLYDACGNLHTIGDVMTDSISLDYPVIETRGIICMSVCPPKRLKFRRC
jgi:hypothetical protein